MKQRTNLRFARFLILCLIFVNGCSYKKENIEPSNGGGGQNETVTDIDGNVYHTAKIGNQVWMAENLNVSRFRNGDSIPQAKSTEEWQRAGENEQPAWCFYNNDPANGGINGKLYNWYCVIDARGLAPEGWHIPSMDEGSRLAFFLGGWAVAGDQLKSTSGWYKNGNGNNESGFNAKAGGYRDCYYGSCAYLGLYGYWWSSTLAGRFNAIHFKLTFNGSQVLRKYDNTMNGFSVRCLK